METAAEGSVLSRQRELSRLRAKALNEGLPLLERAQAAIDRMWLVDDILSEQLRLLQDEESAERD